VCRVAEALGKYPHEILADMSEYEFAMFVTFLNEKESEAPHVGNA